MGRETAREGRIGALASVHSPIRCCPGPDPSHRAARLESPGFERRPITSVGLINRLAHWLNWDDDSGLVAESPQVSGPNGVRTSSPHLPPVVRSTTFSLVDADIRPGSAGHGK